ncbi:three-helix bundle dimerization domain-containing protein [Microbacterium rhizomatis]|uniref:DUF3562 domain-containing protein n=1 Tax=Microbacterium rhizomatis TaxID=1631477 RepID=A0A5J5IYS1_9MICO|nr:hypothetical protein [Microbacterium rhizomatis]KAA9105047.1 hypothetical protein F6B43_18550 [Microbacterium rhizomatis]
MTHDNSDDGDALEQVVVRLTGRFPDLAVDTVRTTVTEVYASFADAHVRDFLPVLVENEAKKQLKSLAR